MQYNQDTLVAEKSKYEAWLSQQPGVTGTGIGLDAGGQISIKIYTNRMTPQVQQAILSRMSDLPVDFEETGEFRAF